MPYKKGDIIIDKFPFTELTQLKKRPALIISNKQVNDTGDYLMVQITSKLKEDELSFVLSELDFENNKELPLKSAIRLHKIFSLNESLILSKFSALNNSTLENITQKITALIK